MNQVSFTILVIDDDEEDLNIFSEAMERIGHPLVCIPSAHSRVALGSLVAKAFVPDLIFLDVHMDDMDGIECLRFLKSRKELSAIPVVMLAGIRNEIICDEALALGALQYFEKPGELNELVSIIKSVLPVEIRKSL